MTLESNNQRLLMCHLTIYIYIFEKINENSISLINLNTILCFISIFSIFNRLIILLLFYIWFTNFQQNRKKGIKKLETHKRKKKERKKKGGKK